MSSSEYEQARRLAHALPRQERTKLVAALLASVDDPANPALEAAWAAAIEQRMAEIDSGSIGYVDTAEFIRTTRARLRHAAEA